MPINNPTTLVFTVHVTACNILTGKPTGHRTSEWPGNRWEEDITMGLKQICNLDFKRKIFIIG